MKIAILPLFLSGCAAMFSGTQDSLTLISPEPETEWSVNGRPIGEGPNVIYKLPRKSNRGTSISATAPGCKPAMYAVDTQLDPVTLLGAFWDLGLISILIVDGAATGAWSKPVETSIYLKPLCPD